jgi:nicotinate-nucleotide adenylyltransferase
VPAGAPPHKPASALAPAADRFAMVSLAIADHPRFAVSALELERPGPSYTVDTLEALRATGDELFLVIGSETFLDLLSWRTPRRVAELARLVVVPRAGSPFDPESAAAQKVLREIGGERLVHVTGPLPPRGVLIVHATSLPISASELRRRARDGRSLAYRLPPAVAAYIAAHRLYTAP